MQQLLQQKQAVDLDEAEWRVVAIAAQQKLKAVLGTTQQ
jgi:hypothetical protein